MKLQPLSRLDKKWRKMWSGKEDSNLRPLPPEGGSPTRTPQKIETPPRTTRSIAAHVAMLFTVPGEFRFRLNLGPLSISSSSRGGAA